MGYRGAAMCNVWLCVNECLSDVTAQCTGSSFNFSFVCAVRKVRSVVAFSGNSMLVHCENVCTLSNTVVLRGSDRPAQFIVSSRAVPVEKVDGQYRRAGAEYGLLQLTKLYTRTYIY